MNLGMEPSPFIQNLYRLMQIRLTRSQLLNIIAPGRSAVLRCAGFLYIRFVWCPNMEALPSCTNKHAHEQACKHPLKRPQAQTRNIGERKPFP